MSGRKDKLLRKAVHNQVNENVTVNFFFFVEASKGLPLKLRLPIIWKILLGKGRVMKYLIYLLIPFFALVSALMWYGVFVVYTQIHAVGLVAFLKGLL